MKRSTRIGLVVVISAAGGFFILFAAAQFLFLVTPPAHGPKVAVVRIEGVITDSKLPVELLKKYADDPDVKAVVVRINSPGGAVAPSQEIYEELMKLRRRGKKAVASMGGVAASGAYYVASATDRIYANPGTITGSIGVIAQLFNAEELLKKIGVQSMAVKSGRFKDLGSFARGMTGEEKKVLQDVLEDIHGQFIETVAMRRNLDRQKVEDLADGRIYSGSQAKELDLVDELGNFQDAIDAAGEMAGIAGAPQVIEEGKRGLLFRIIQGELPGGLDLQGLLRGGLSVQYIMPF